MKFFTSPIRLPPYKVKYVASVLSQATGWGLKQLNVPSTWSITQGENQTVLIIDTGYSDHIDLKDSVVKEFCANFTSENDIIDKNGHSTHVAGIIAANNNSFGTVGVAPKCKIITVKVLDGQGTGTSDMVNKALEYAIQIKPNIVSMSLGTKTYDIRMHNLIKELHRLNIPVVAAAGNDGGVNTINYPGKFPEVICVGAYDPQGKIADFSSTGPEVSFAAPGVGIYSTWLDNQYALLDGTSMATPFVTGIVCLLLAKHRKQEQETGNNDCKTVDQIKEHLIKYTDDKGAIGYDSMWGYGIINVQKLIFEGLSIPSSKKKTIFTKFFERIKKIFYG